MKRGTNIWDILAWLALFSIVVWVTLKVIGIINTPPWLEYAPVYSAAYVAGWLMHQVKSTGDDVKELKNFKDATIKEIHSIKENCTRKHK